MWGQGNTDILSIIRYFCMTNRQKTRFRIPNVLENLEKSVVLTGSHFLKWLLQSMKNFTI